jgi:hypothetical protein
LHYYKKKIFKIIRQIVVSHLLKVYASLEEYKNISYSTRKTALQEREGANGGVINPDNQILGEVNIKIASAPQKLEINERFFVVHGCA